MNADEQTAEYIRLIGSVTNCYRVQEVFRDACRMYAIALHNAVEMSGEYRASLEKEFADLRAKYGEDGYSRIIQSFALVADALDTRRQDFLGHILERLNCNEKGFGQFFTPTSVSRMMARILGGETKHEAGRVVKVCDPACGAGVLLVEQAESLIQDGVPQRDIMIDASDLDGLACSIAYVQFTLLGYAARVTHMDALSLEVLERPWYTMGWFLHGMPFRLRERNAEAEVPAPTPTPTEEPKEQVSYEQMELL